MYISYQLTHTHGYSAQIMSYIKVASYNYCNLPTTGAIARTNAAFGQGSTFTPLFTSVMCAGLESRLLDCAIVSPATAGCSHSQDVGVSCMEGT